ncbi:sulfite exporter TauE/SafE family protein [Pseudodesulfovibrio sediminis]|uniref:Probable membrane transporter protein n=1 Tax=Pseudodesulfovibrio sediminis TaxID=2810563 RepID=A0ABM7P6Y7_9BACT|nr:sulfite exporter TauE/SafE family protein [Pseudodesulfovibrio sediminis]BCS88711.1 membrane protein [Pseudodesulfovibrio sediminis]
MEPLIIACILATFFFAAFLKGTAGLGFATTCLGIMATYIDLRLAIPLVIIPSLISNTMVMIDAGGFVTIFKRFRILYATCIPGLILGLWILGSGDTVLPRTVLGVSMVLYGSWGLWGGTARLEHSPLLDSTIGLLTGLVNGLTGSQIMPILPYLMSLDITKDELVQAINTSFTISSLIMLLGLGKLGLVNTEVMLISAVGTLPVGAGIWLGGRVRRILPEAVFRKVMLTMITLLGLGLVVRAIL